MPENRLILKLTAEQQKQILDATGNTATGLSIDLTPFGSLSEEELAQASGGTDTQQSGCSGTATQQVGLGLRKSAGNDATGILFLG